MIGAISASQMYAAGGVPAGQGGAPEQGSAPVQAPAPQAPAPQAPAPQAPVPQASANDHAVMLALNAQEAAAEKAAKQAAKAQASMIDKVTSQSAADLTFHPSQVRFQRDLETGRVAVEVYDTLTGEKTGQMPSEQLMRTLANIHEQIGLLLDKKA